ncbi:sulfotransferase family protein [Dyella sp.]|uniref:sulfotransferase family protein n=1 Tax=Dyella sp. TaxID=1869338 RepID=UPI003F7E5B59
MNKQEPTAILVAGMHRSGTSALTGALGAMGVALGDRLLTPGVDNPKGYWEHEDAVAIHERLLLSLERHWDDVRPMPSGWQSSEAARIASEEIAALISRDFALSPLWAIKDPRICRFLPLWIVATKRLGIRPVVLFVARQPSEVAASIEKRNQWATPIGELLWLRHVLEADQASRDLRRAAVTYNDLLSDPAGAVSAALRHLGVQGGNDGRAGRELLSQFVDASDRHHRHEKAQESSSGFGIIAMKAYQALANTARDGDGWSDLRQCAERFDELWCVSGAEIEAVADMAHKIRCSAAAAQLEMVDLSSRLNAQVQWSEQAVVIRSEMRSEHQLALEAVVAGRERLAGEIEALRAQFAQEYQNQEARMHELAQLREAERHALQAVQLEATSLRADIDQLRRSWSWRLTRPLRGLGRLLRSVLPPGKG